MIWNHRAWVDYSLWGKVENLTAHPQLFQIQFWLSSHEACRLEQNNKKIESIRIISNWSNNLLNISFWNPWHRNTQEDCCSITCHFSWCYVLQEVFNILGWHVLERWTPAKSRLPHYETLFTDNRPWLVYGVERISASNYFSEEDVKHSRLNSGRSFREKVVRPPGTNRTHPGPRGRGRPLQYVKVALWRANCKKMQTRTDLVVLVAGKVGIRQSGHNKTLRFCVLWYWLRCRLVEFLTNLSTQSFKQGGIICANPRTQGKEESSVYFLHRPSDVYQRVLILQWYCY